jgi:hypothetical protein
MAETSFFIVLNIKTGEGFESCGKFFIGNDRGLANNIFKKLKGDKKVTEKSILTLDLMETSRGLPVNMQVISCTLEELAENCKIITKEIFMRLNLKEL